MGRRSDPLVLTVALALAVGGCGGSSDDHKPSAKRPATDIPATNPSPSTPADCLAGGQRRGARVWVGRWSGEAVRIERFDSRAAARRAASASGSPAAPVAGYVVFAPGTAVVGQVARCLRRVPYRAAPPTTTTTPPTATQPAQTQTSQSQQCPPGQVPTGSGGCTSSGGAPSVDSPEGQRRLRTNPDCKGLPPPPPGYHGPVQC